MVSLADRPLVELVVDPHGSNMCDSLTSSTQHQSERAMILFVQKQFVEKHLVSNKKKFFQSALSDWLSQDDELKPSAAVSHTWDDTNDFVSQAGQDGAALVNPTCARDSCSSGELHIKHVNYCLKASECYSETCIKAIYWYMYGPKLCGLFIEVALNGGLKCM